MQPFAAPFLPQMPQGEVTKRGLYHSETMSVTVLCLTVPPDAVCKEHDLCETLVTY